jgi:hypothetical protein
MADHFYGVATEGLVNTRAAAGLTIGTSSTASCPIELRVTDAAVTALDVHKFCELLADFFGARDARVVAAGSLKG